MRPALPAAEPLLTADMSVSSCSSEGGGGRECQVIKICVACCCIF